MSSYNINEKFIYKYENDIDKKEQVFCIFNNDKENIDKQIEKSFIIYLKSLIKDNKEPWRFE